MAALFWTVPSQAETKLGIVKKNSFVLSKKPNVKRQGSYLCGLVGYLPIGRRVWWNADPVTVKHLKESRPETYYPVKSSIGIGGLLHKDTFIEVGNRPVAVVIGNEQTWLHNPDPAKGEFNRLMKIGRYGPAAEQGLALGLQLHGHDRTQTKKKHAAVLRFSPHRPAAVKAAGPNTKCSIKRPCS